MRTASKRSGSSVLSILSVKKQRRSAVARAAGWMVELLEERRLLTTFAHINFQTAPPNPAVPAGYLADVGLKFGDRGNGFTYGWWYAPSGTAVSVDNPAVRNRGTINNTPDIRFRTFDHFHKVGQSPNSDNNALPVWWEINVPNGLYHVRTVSGDPENHDSYFSLIAEAAKDANGVPDTTGATGTVLVHQDVRAAANNYPDNYADSGVVDVTVTDGTLTISEGPDHFNSKIDFIDIDNDSVTPTVPAASTNLQITSTKASSVALHWTDNSNDPNSENGFRIESSTDGVAYTPFGTAGKNITDFVAAGLNPQTKYFFRVFAFNLIGDSATPTTPVNTTTLAATGSITSSFQNTSGDVDLTAEGSIDWAHWGEVDASTYDHKAGVTSLISDLTPLPGSPRNRITNSPTTFSWSNGTPDVSGGNSPNAVSTIALGHGFTFTVPADTTARVLRVYVGVNNMRARFTARLSDGSAADIVDSTFFNGGASDGAFLMVYKAGSAGQTMTVTWSEVGPDGDQAGGTINIKAATLQTLPPPPTGVTNNLTAAALVTGRVKLSWDEQSTGNSGYSVERAPNVAGVPGTFVQIGTTTNPNYYFFDGTTSPATKYFYRVRPINFANVAGPASNVVTLTTVPGPYGDGARASYFNLPTAPIADNNPALTPLWPVSSIDPTIDFNWGNGAPPGAGAGFPTDNFIVRWTAKIKPEFTGDYTFYADTDDGYRLIVNGVTLLDGLSVRRGLGTQTASPTITLTAGQTYDLVFDQIEAQGGAGARLYWSEADLPQEIVPQLALFHSALDLVPPTVTGIQFDGPIPAGLTYTAAQHMVVRFSESVSGTLDVNDLSITAADFSASYGGGQLEVSFDPASNSALITFPTIPNQTLPDTNYILSIDSSGVGDNSGNLLDGNGDGTGGDLFNANFYVLTGDTQVRASGTSNVDRKVDFVDFQRLELGFGKVAANRPSAADGDFNHDGVVDRLDLKIFNQHLNAVLPPAPAAVPASASIVSPAPAPAAVATKPVNKPVIAVKKPVPVVVKKPVVAAKPVVAHKPGFAARPTPPQAPTFGAKRVKAVGDWLAGT